MRILHINPAYPFTTLYAHMLEAFSTRHSHTVYVPLAIGRELPHWYTMNDDRIIHSRDYRQLERFFYTWKTSKITESLSRQIDVAAFGLAHAHFLFSAGGVANSLKSAVGLRYVVSVRNTDANVFFKYGVHLRQIGLRIMREAERVIFINPLYRERVLSDYVPRRWRDDIECRTVVIPNGIDAFWLSQSQAKSGPPPEGIVSLLYVGQFTKNKNVETVVRAAKALRHRGYEVRLDLVGDGPTLTRVRRLSNNETWVKFHGRIDSKSVLLQRYREADIFVMPSFTETFGLVYAEAMSQGVPIIYTKGQGIDGYFEDGHVGYAVDPRSPTEIADRVEDILENYNDFSLRCVRAAQHFCWKEISRRLELLYEDAAL